VSPPKKNALVSSNHHLAASPEPQGCVAQLDGNGSQVPWH